MQRTLLLPMLAMAMVVVASNILVQFLLGDWLTWGALTYPLAFFVTDVTNRLHGPVAARRVVYAGFAVGLACSLAGTQIEGSFGPLVSLRVAIASGAAFLVGQLLDITVFNRLRAMNWWLPPLASSLIGSAVDTIVFFSLAFAGSLAFLAPQVDVAWANVPVALWVSLAVADFSVKIALALVTLVPFRMIVARRARVA